MGHLADCAAAETPRQAWIPHSSRTWTPLEPPLWIVVYVCKVKENNHTHAKHVSPLAHMSRFQWPASSVAIARPRLSLKSLSWAAHNHFLAGAYGVKLVVVVYGKRLVEQHGDAMGT